MQITKRPGQIWWLMQHIESGVWQVTMWLVVTDWYYPPPGWWADPHLTTADCWPELTHHLSVSSPPQCIVTMLSLVALSWLLLSSSVRAASLPTSGQSRAGVCEEHRTVLQPEILQNNRGAACSTILLISLVHSHCSRIIEASMHRKELL